MIPAQQGSQRLPPWFKVPLSTSARFNRVRNRISEGGLHTVCQSAACPNRNECWNAGTATFLILGEVCTRGCGFCNIPRGRPDAPDPREPERVARAVAALGLSYAVVTSVTRDDLPDGGARMFSDTIRAIRKASPQCGIEVLIPDLQGSVDALDLILTAMPDVLNHNIETVPALYDRVRPQADYGRSLRVLAHAYDRGFITKSGIMVGLGEKHSDVLDVIADLKRVGCNTLTIGQYLRPGRRNLRVQYYYEPEEFERLAIQCREMGITQVAAGPRVRSSYRAKRFGPPSGREDLGVRQGEGREP